MCEHAVRHDVTVGCLAEQYTDIQGDTDEYEYYVQIDVYMFDHTSNITSISVQYNGLTQLQRAYKRQRRCMRRRRRRRRWKHRGDSTSA